MSSGRLLGRLSLPLCRPASSHLVMNSSARWEGTSKTAPFWSLVSVMRLASFTCSSGRKPRRKPHT